MSCNKVCIVFRGENLRHKRGRTSALDCVDNWKESIFDVIDCDVAFFTYDSPILDGLINKLTPIHVRTTGYDSQEGNALAAMDWMIENRDRYDRFVLVRFDIMYRKKIVDWIHWEKNGITHVSKLVNYPTTQVLSDFVFIIDHEWVSQFKDALLTKDEQKDCLHRLHLFLKEMNVPIYVMYDEYYHLTNHPFHAWHPIETKPNIDDNYQGQIVLDVSPWNPALQTPLTLPPMKKTQPTRKARVRPVVLFKR